MLRPWGVGSKRRDVLPVLQSLPMLGVFKLDGSDNAAFSSEAMRSNIKYKPHLDCEPHLPPDPAWTSCLFWSLSFIVLSPLPPAILYPSSENCSPLSADCYQWYLFVGLWSSQVQGNILAHLQFLAMDLTINLCLPKSNLKDFQGFSCQELRQENKVKYTP